MVATYGLQQSDKMQSVDPSKNKLFMSRYFWYITCTIATSMFIILAYDLLASKGDFSEYCDLNDPIYRNMVSVMYTISFINKVAQIVLFIMYLYYWQN